MKVFQVMIPVLFISLFGACTNSNDDVAPSLDSVVTNNGGTWRVSYYFDKDKDETSDYSGYQFRFRDDGILEATRDGATTSGTWKVIRDDGVQKLVINTGTTARPLEKLTDDWVIMEQTTTRIRLQDDNDEHLEELHFEKL